MKKHRLLTVPKEMSDHIDYIIDASEEEVVEWCERMKVFHEIIAYWKTKSTVVRIPFMTPEQETLFRLRWE